MLVFRLNTVNELGAVARFAPSLTDTLVLNLKNENTEVTASTELMWYLHTERIIFELVDVPEDFEPTNTYEISIVNQTTDVIIYRGRLLVVDEFTDIQNYTPSTQITTPAFIVKD